MRRLSVALIANLVWLSAALLAGGCLVLFGAGLVTYLAAAVLLSLAFALTTWLGLRAERAFRARLVTLGGALGLKEHEATSIEAIVSSLCQRLDRAQQFKSAFQHMRHPAMLVSSEGKLTGLSAGTEALDGRAGEGVELAGLFGEASAATNAAGEHIVTLGRRRFAAARHDLPAGRVLVELQPSGHHIADDDFEAFVAALGSGRTGFRFDDWSMQHSPGLRALGQALESLDKPLRALQQLLVGDEVDRALLSGTSPFALQVRQFHDAIEEILAERDEAVSQRDLLEAKMEAILRAIDRYRASVTSLAELADQSRAGLAVAAGAIGKGRERARAVRELEREAVQLTTDAALAVQRAGQAVDGVGSATREIDKMVSAIEDVSFRTNLLALNAAVEAARAGEKGAGFAVVAGEVRTLAQATQKAAKEIRSMVGSSRARSDQSAAETEQLKKILTGLGSHLENLSNETDMIAGALDEGSGAIERLDSSVNAVGTVAAKALQLPARKKSAS